MINVKSRYYYTRLDSESRRIYDSILAAWVNRDREPSFTINPFGASIDVQSIIKFIHWDNPGLFYVDFSNLLITGSFSKTTVKSEFIFSDRQIDDAERYMSQSIREMLSAAPLSGHAIMNAYHKEIALHDKLAEKISYEHRGITKTSTTIVGGLLQNKAVCEGYAKTFRLLCDQVGLSCIFLAGKAKPHDKPIENHSWNIVKLNGVCAHVDITWDSTMRVAGGGPCYDHFNITDDDISRDHVWDRMLTPRCASSANSYFEKKGCIVRSDAEFHDYFNRQAAAGSRNFSIKIAYGEYDQNRIMRMIQKILSSNSSPGLSRYETMSLRYNPTRKIAEVIFA